MKAVLLNITALLENHSILEATGQLPGARRSDGVFAGTPFLPKLDLEATFLEIGEMLKKMPVSPLFLSAWDKR